MPISIQQLPLPDEVVEIDPDLMDPSPYQMRIEVYEDEDDLKQLAIGIQRLGMDPVPKVRPSPKSPWTLRDNDRAQKARCGCQVSEVEENQMHSIQKSQ